MLDHIGAKANVTQTQKDSQCRLAFIHSNGSRSYCELDYLITRSKCCPLYA
jgi:hypothetical protein